MAITRIDYKTALVLVATAFDALLPEESGGRIFDRVHWAQDEPVGLVRWARIISLDLNAARTSSADGQADQADLVLGVGCYASEQAPDGDLGRVVSAVAKLLTHTAPAVVNGHTLQLFDYRPVTVEATPARARRIRAANMLIRGMVYRASGDSIST